MLDLREHVHRRFNPLRNEWVIVSPHRNQRPWQGTVDAAPAESDVGYDPTCYLCPGNARASGARTPAYTSTFVFDNDFPALAREQVATESEVRPFDPAQGRPELVEGRLKPDATTKGMSTWRPPLGGPAGDPELLVAEPERGICRVVCFSPRHDLALARLDAIAIRAVVETWIQECTALAEVPWVGYATIFENRGAVMGASNPHPHGQIWATEHVPNDPALELAALTAYRARRGSCLLCDYVALELAAGERIVCANDGFVALVPFWAAWPFETLVVSRRHADALTSLDDGERGALADMLKQLTTRYDNVFGTAFPYSMGFHQQPVRGRSPDAAHVHAHFYPPLLRSATVRKFMGGFELLGSPQRDLTPEEGAARLQAVSSVHYRQQSKTEVTR